MRSINSHKLAARVSFAARVCFGELSRASHSTSMPWSVVALHIYASVSRPELFNAPSFITGHYSYSSCWFQTSKTFMVSVCVAIRRQPLRNRKRTKKQSAWAELIRHATLGIERCETSIACKSSPIVGVLPRPYWRGRLRGYNSRVSIPETQYSMYTAPSIQLQNNNQILATVHISGTIVEGSFLAARYMTSCSWPGGTVCPSQHLSARVGFGRDLDRAKANTVGPVELCRRVCCVAV
jgi:hypothetical protein